jgi:hypothetical protein
MGARKPITRRQALRLATIIAKLEHLERTAGDMLIQSQFARIRADLMALAAELYPKPEELKNEAGDEARGIPRA